MVCYERIKDTADVDDHCLNVDDIECDLTHVGRLSYAGINIIVIRIGPGAPLGVGVEGVGEVVAAFVAVDVVRVACCRWC